MACLICGKNSFRDVRKFNTPDKYEKYMGIENVKRTWKQCRNCGFYIHKRNYALPRLEAIYQRGYRDKAFRGMTIRQAYNMAYTIPASESESQKRADWFKRHAGDSKTVWDIGSGLGIFPVHLRNLGYQVACTETNVSSKHFIKNVLKFKMIENFPTETVIDVVSMVHVLEHINTDLGGFLESYRLVSKNMFIEVPDAYFLNEIEDTHDDLNSCHLWGFDLKHIITLLENTGFVIKSAERVHYEKRNLHRIMVMAQCN